jgi:hypothetical protein
MNATIKVLSYCMNHESIILTLIVLIARTSDKQDLWVPCPDAMLNSIELDSREDLSNKNKCGLISDCPSENKYHKGDDHTVTKVQKHRQRLGDAELSVVIKHRVNKHIQCTGSRCQERTPPPFVVSPTQADVTEDDTHLGACDSEDQEDQKHESEHVVVMSEPDRREYKVHFDKDRPKGKQTARKDCKQWMQVPFLPLGQRSRDDIGLARVVDLVTFEPKVPSSIAQRNMYTKPHEA